ncbi:hypothetical protein CWE08_11685 [Aliidiomarina iranensis]|uniref:Type II secretory pathway component n=1 Tax=Aliidiomarina iranensis TaxID=1434071 RepID=A0A432VQ60_9GAMM|nr:hypothetical protein [Aliidiomarina iranensis]RUO18308.1 hypothetical protein CWE08_11685 [Aliidiomarina iranensis]
MIALILILLNLTTAILLDSIEEGLLNLRLSQTDIHLARAWRAQDSALAYAYAQFEQGVPIYENLNFTSDLSARAQQSPVDCELLPELPVTPTKVTGSATATAQCWLLKIEVQQLSQRLRLQKSYWLYRGPSNERFWLPKEGGP